MKRHIYLIIFGIAISMAVLAFLYYNFSTNRISDQYLKNGGFERKLLSLNLSLEQKYGLNKGYYRIVGADHDKVIIHELNASNLVVFNPDHTKETIQLPNEIIPENIFSISIPPYDKKLIDIHCNNDNKIFVFDTKTQEITSIFVFTTFFEKAVRASENSFYTFIQGDKRNETILTHIQFDENGKEHIIKSSNIIRRSMTDDGILQKYNGDLLYVNYYNNTIALIDSGLNKELLYHTIDTITTEPKTVTIRNGTITKFVKAPRPVNQLVQTFDNFLFVNSYVSADNDKDNFPRGTSDLIDVYDIEDELKYVGTIYLKRIDNNRIIDFFADENTLVLQYTDKILVYDISL
ncbi:hypothetical protein [Parapedobacter sp. 10938]|uniref:hypothetical protein n=1 Tax=Parapedobacter flavus TaxID=3110225 RepID=UPI002DBDBB0A|nr:hypothetical protein [Parapedobacter sp. 10938]MEC3878159.1 hypothetical protein [Parapedobacter sp. 10938]